MKRTALSLLIALSLIGCATTPTANIAVFGDVTKGVTDKLDASIKEYNDANIQNELNKLAQHSNPISIKSLDPVKTVIIQDADKKDYLIYKANKALGSYAAALSGLAKAGSREEIDLAAAKLYGSIHTFNEEYKGVKGSNLIDDKTSATIGRAIAEIGSLYVEQKRGNALKVIIVSANEPVQKICDVIINDLMKGTIQSRLYVMSNTELTGYISDYNDMVAKASFVNKKKAIDVIYQKYISMQGASVSVEQAIAALQAVKKAHATITQEVKEDRFTSKSIIDAIGDLKDTHDHYNKLEELMLSCKGKITTEDKKGFICKEDTTK
jgi:hypothetical protein